MGGSISLPLAGAPFLPPGHASSSAWNVEEPYNAKDKEDCDDSEDGAKCDGQVAFVAGSAVIGERDSSPRRGSGCDDSASHRG